MTSARPWPSLTKVKLAVIGLALVLTGCTGAASDANAPYTVAGLNAEIGAAAPGEPTYAGIPTAIRTGSVVLESATLAQLSGFPLPHMVGVGLVPSKDWLTGGQGWPIRNAPVGRNGTAPVRPLAGYVLTAGHPIAIYYAFSGDRSGQTYYAAGIRLTYRRGTQDYTVMLYQIGADCVVAGYPKVAAKTCDISPAANKQINALPHP